MSDPASTWLIVGLGNPGREYESTRHNIGFMFVDYLAQRWSADAFQSKFGGVLAQVRRAGGTSLLFKPQSYMNLSGGPVQQAARFFKVQPVHVLVVCDDVNIPFGHIRLREKGSGGGQKGLTSVCQTLGSTDIPRLRLGIGGGEAGRDLTGWVLGRFSADQRPILDEFLERAALCVETLLARNLGVAASLFNGDGTKKTNNSAGR